MAIQSRPDSPTPRPRRRSFLVGLGVLVGFLVAAGVALTEGFPSRWTVASASPSAPTSAIASFRPTGSMTTARSGPTATVLEDGRVLIAGGYDGSVYLNSAELYDPKTGRFSPTGSMITADDGTTTTLLLDGRVLFVGHTSAELYNPTTGTFSRTGPMASDASGQIVQYLSGPSATLLSDGRVLLAGPVRLSTPLGGASGSLEQLYDPKTGKFTLATSTIEARVGYTATLLKDGRVLFVGRASAELYDPMTGTFRATGSMTTAHSGATATLLKDGRVLIVGGADGSVYLNSAERYDPATGTFSPTGSTATARYGHIAVMLADDRVLVAGGAKHDLTQGFKGAQCETSAELYDPETGKFTPARWTTAGRCDYVVAPLLDGRVLIAGGYTPGPVVARLSYLASADLYEP